MSVHSSNSYYIPGESTPRDDIASVIDHERQLRLIGQVSALQIVPNETAVATPETSRGEVVVEGYAELIHFIGDAAHVARKKAGTALRAFVTGPGGNSANRSGIYDWAASNTEDIPKTAEPIRPARVYDGDGVVIADFTTRRGRGRSSVVNRLVGF